MYPQDCATTNDNRRAAVRYADPTNNAAIVSIYQLTGTGLPTGALVTHGGGTFKSGEQTDLASGPSGYRPSDRIELTNEWGVSIGSGISSVGSTLDETYIEVFDVGSTTPTYFVQFEQNPNAANEPASRAGFAHDLAITRDAKWAIVNSENWIHLISLDSTTMTATRLPGLNIGGGVAGTCNPNAAVDSVAVTNERAVVTTARPSGTFGTFTTWVYIVDLTPSTGPAIVLEHEIPPDADWEPIGDDHDRPHDVAITPTRDGGGTLAVVTTNHATAFYDLITNTFIASDFEAKFRRAYQQQVDSVELTGKTAVVIADEVAGGTSKWAVRIYDLSSATISSPVADYVDANPPLGGSRAHDLAIDWDFDKGLVRTSYSNVVLDSLMFPPATSNPIASPNGSNAYAYEAYAGTTGNRVFSSDSVVLGSEQNGALYGVTIGARLSGGVLTGTVDVIDVLAASPTVVQVDILPATGDEVGCVPLDLAISFSQAEVVVRSTDTINQVAPTGDGPDLVRIPLAGGTVVRFGGSGTVFGLDSLATPPLLGYVNTVRRLMSISEDPFPSGLDYTHFAK
jgi:hypothetical protein